MKPIKHSKYFILLIIGIKKSRTAIRGLLLYTLILFTSFNFSCEDFINVGPPSNQLVSSTVFEDDVTATGAMIGLYSKFSNTGGFSDGGISSITFIGSMSSDELICTYSQPDYLEFFNNNILPTNAILRSFWDQGYSYIYDANSIIEGLDASDKVTLPVKNQLLGEAKVFRAFTHFYLVNLFGKIPFIETTNYELNTRAERMEISIVYDKIIKDLLDAKLLLTEDYSFSNNERIRINRFVASALLARVYLFNGNWTEAEAEASYVINATDLYDLASLDEVFLKNSEESIWQLIINGQNYTNEGQLFLSETSVFSKVSDELVTSFESADERRNKWITELNVDGSTFFAPFKYKDFSEDPAAEVNEYSMILRLAEQYLIRAEARAQNNNVLGANSAESDLNMIRSRANLNPTIANTKEDMLDAILDERRFEFFAEWGHRWIDLKRVQKADEVLSSLKADWQPTDKLYPIPHSETLINPNMPQNDGY